MFCYPCHSLYCLGVTPPSFFIDFMFFLAGDEAIARLKVVKYSHNEIFQRFTVLYIELRMAVKTAVGHVTISIISFS